MYNVKALTPDHALETSLQLLAKNHVYSESRNGPVLRFPGLVVTEWEDPTKRISWSTARDANPFLHYIEAFWMLAGRNDVSLVGKIASNMFNYSDDGKTLFGAYGYRWRNHFGVDQISKIIAELLHNRTSRRCVLQMWDGYTELDRAINNGKDVCCNHSITFDPCGDLLNMTVSNRSNDLVWGAYGANVVHMSILHEYIAAQSNFKLGTYYQCSSNLHLYLDNPVTKRLCSYENGVLKVKPIITTFFGPQEAMFCGISPLPELDHLFVDRINSILNAFLEGDVSNTSNIANHRSLEILHTLCAAFNVYKSVSAREAVGFLLNKKNCSTSKWSPWEENAIAWLYNRPSINKS